MKCLRCGKEYDDPVPEIIQPDGVTEIATREWCAGCNAFAMSIVYRGRSAYSKPVFYDPSKGGQECQ